MGRGAWGMGHGAWGMGYEVWDIESISYSLLLYFSQSLASELRRSLQKCSPQSQSPINFSLPYNLPLIYPDQNMKKD